MERLGIYAFVVNSVRECIDIDILENVALTFALEVDCINSGMETELEHFGISSEIESVKCGNKRKGTASCRQTGFFIAYRANCYPRVRVAGKTIRHFQGDIFNREGLRIYVESLICIYKVSAKLCIDAYAG